MDPHTWLIYSVAALGLSLSPDQTAYSLSPMVLSTDGVAPSARSLEALGFTILIALSLWHRYTAAIHAVRLTVLKLVGGLYHIWLGIQVWQAPPRRYPCPSAAQFTNDCSFSPGGSSAVTNPKGILFFAAFLPQFVDPQRELLLQFVLMAATFVVIETSLNSASLTQLSEFVLATTSGATLQPSLRRAVHHPWFGSASGTKVKSECCY